MLRIVLFVASLANIAGGLVLIVTWATMWQRVPIIVLAIGGSLLIQGIAHNINNADMEMAPVLAGLLMLVQALLALLYLVATDRLRPRITGRSSA